MNAETQSWSQNRNSVGGVQEHDWTDDYCQELLECGTQLCHLPWSKLVDLTLVSTCSIYTTAEEFCVEFRSSTSIVYSCSNLLTSS